MKKFLFALMLAAAPALWSHQARVEIIPSRPASMLHPAAPLALGAAILTAAVMVPVVVSARVPRPVIVERRCETPRYERRLRRAHIRHHASRHGHRGWDRD